LDAFGIAALRLPNLPSKLTEEQIPLVRAAGRAQALIALQDRVAAENELKQLAALYASQPGVNYMYGVFLLKEHPALAVDAFRREIEVSPSDAAPRIQVALEFSPHGRLPGGSELCERGCRVGAKQFRRACSVWQVVRGNWKNRPCAARIANRGQTRSRQSRRSLCAVRALWKAGRKSEAEREQTEFERLKALVDAADR